MTLNHVHLQVRDLPAAVHWFALVLELKPGFQNERIATFIFGVMTIIIDAGPVDSPATLGFESDDCDRDFEMVVSRGAVSIEAPVNKEWGVRTAYFKGPRDQIRNRGSSCNGATRVSWFSWLTKLDRVQRMNCRPATQAVLIASFPEFWPARKLRPPELRIAT